MGDGGRGSEKEFRGWEEEGWVKGYVISKCTPSGLPMIKASKFKVFKSELKSFLC